MNRTAARCYRPARGGGGGGRGVNELILPPTNHGHLRPYHLKALVPTPVPTGRKATKLQSSERLTLILGYVQDGPGFKVGMMAGRDRSWEEGRQGESIDSDWVAGTLPWPCHL